MIVSRAFSGEMLKAQWILSLQCQETSQVLTCEGRGASGGETERETNTQLSKALNATLRDLDFF